MSKVHARAAGKHECLQDIGQNRADFEAVEMVCRAFRGQFGRPMSYPIEFDGIKALFIAQGLPQSQRLERLNRIAIQQMTLLAGDGRVQLAGGGE
ncbi:hypothetical protein [uncultured Nitrosomonas sp.]|uniref:hypothetical protein n=1 Tax=uncultured Nitrosomonas sp. TaxID=156424 RepID=UPI0026185E68|nr:hypothetical protein [uncultured Nitrosomonas sp.]